MDINISVVLVIIMMKLDNDDNISKETMKWHTTPE